MNIIHINNYANVSTELRNAQRKLGHISNIIQVNRGSLIYNFEEDYRFFDENTLFSRLGYRLNLLDLINRADIIHIHGGFWHKYISRYIRLRNKKLIFHYHGSDVRLNKKGFGARKNEEFANKIILATPDLKAYCSNGIYIPNPIESKREILYYKKGVVKIIHAHSLHKNLEEIKGSETIRKVISETFQNNITYKEVYGVSHAKALEEYNKCDLAIDQIRIGWYGMFAMECMSMGIPTLGLKKNFYDIPNPIYNVTSDSLKETLEDFIKSPGLRNFIGVKQKQFIEENHNPLKIAQRIESEIYEI
jgi:glycosyltransferase involved in cell wall biosynthesis